MTSGNMAIVLFIRVKLIKVDGGSTIVQSSRSEPRLKNYLKWRETLLLVSYILDDIVRNWFK